MQRFLGITKHYRDFVDDYSARTPALRALRKGDVPHRWAKLNDKETAEMKWLKEEMVSTRVALHHPEWNEEFIVQTDACADGLGAVLAQKFEHRLFGKPVERPVRYASRSLQAPEARWTTRK